MPSQSRHITPLSIISSHLSGTLSLVDRWLSQLDSSNISPEDCLFPRENKELVDYLYDTVDGRKTSRILSTTSSKDLKDYAEKAISMPMSPVGKSSLKDKQDKGADNQNVDLLRCFAVIYERKGKKTEQSRRKGDSRVE